MSLTVFTKTIERKFPSITFTCCTLGEGYEAASIDGVIHIYYMPDEQPWIINVVGDSLDAVIDKLSL